jgi:hypothetical protein
MGNEQPHLLTIAVPGVVANSPLGNGLTQALKGLAEAAPMGRLPHTSALWRRCVRGTALDWFGATKTRPSTISASSDVLLDLHGEGMRPQGRTWQFVDAVGICVLRPFSCLTTNAAAPLVTSLYLIEANGAGTGWAVLAEAHLSSRRSYRNLLDAVGRTIIWLVSAGIRRRPDVPKPWRPWVRGTQKYGSRGVPYSRMASLRARLRDHVASEIWAIGRVVEPIEEFLRTRTVEPDSWVEIPAREGFIADPFPWPGREDMVLYERYSHHTGRGSIEAMVPPHTETSQIQKLDLNVHTHLSYPSTYSTDEHVICLPEMAAERRQMMYTLHPDRPPRELCLVAEHVAMADPTLFVHEGLYWIAYNDADIGLHENLCLKFATRLEGPWISHPLNPVKVDVRSSRPAGSPFRVRGSLFRPAQDCSRSYGCALTMNRIIACTPACYAEEMVATLLPNPNGRFPDGLHTFSVAPNAILVDGKRFILDWNILLQRLGKRLRRTGVLGG